MKFCIVGCDYRRYNSKNNSLHRFVRNGKPREDWLEAVMCLNDQFIDPSTVGSVRICTAHFEESYTFQIGLHKTLSPDAVPTIFPKMLEEGIENVKFLSSSHASDEPTNISNTSDEVVNMDWAPSCSGINALSENIQLVEIQQPPQSTISQICAENVQRAIVPQEPSEQTTPRTLKRQNSSLREIVERKTKALKTMQQKLRRKDQKIKTLKSLMMTLEKKKHFIRKCFASFTGKCIFLLYYFL